MTTDDPGETPVILPPGFELREAEPEIREAMESFTLRMPPQLAEQISVLAQKDERTWSWMVRRLVEEGLASRGVEPYRAPGLHLM